MGESLPTRTLIVRDDDGKIRDLEDVIKIARSVGQTIFGTHSHVRVLKIIGPFKDGAYCVEVEGPSCSDTSGVRGRKTSSK